MTEYQTFKPMRPHVGQQMRSSRWKVTIFNQHAGCGIHAYGQTRREAFNLALARAGEPFLRYGGDKLTIMRTLFHDVITGPFSRGTMRSSSTSPHGACVEIVRLVQRDREDGFWSEPV